MRAELRALLISPPLAAIHHLLACVVTHIPIIPTYQYKGMAQVLRIQNDLTADPPEFGSTRACNRYAADARGPKIWKHR